MYICKEVLTKQVCQEILAGLTEWEKGRTNLDKSHKDNFEIRDSKYVNTVFQAITNHEIIKDYSFICKMATPRFNKYENSGKYSDHVDFFIQEGVRTDWSMTLFLTDDYEGGELNIGNQSIKLPAGDMVLYPSGQIHSVNPVTRGQRIAAITWAQSYVEDIHERDILAKLVDVMKKVPKEDLVNLSFVYNNLLRKWSK